MGCLTGADANFLPCADGAGFEKLSLFKCHKANPVIVYQLQQAFVAFDYLVDIAASSFNHSQQAHRLVIETFVRGGYRFAGQAQFKVAESSLHNTEIAHHIVRGFASCAKNVIVDR
jgi:hypothetical protein